MAEVLHRIVYDASIDDAVDVAWRLANRSQAFQKQIRFQTVAGSVASGLIIFVIGAYFGNLRDPSKASWVLVASIGAGLLFGRLFRRELVKQVFKQHRKVVSEQFGHKPAIPSELELRSDAVWVRQSGMEMTFPWNICTGVQDNPGDIEIGFAPGICVIRNRHFGSPAERQDFLAAARRLSAGSDVVNRGQ
jgi:hypothetical protein